MDVALEMAEGSIDRKEFEITLKLVSPDRQIIMAEVDSDKIIH